MFVGARTHSTIAAFSSGVPVVPMAYSRKFNGLFSDTLDYQYIVDMKIKSLDESLAKIIEAFNQRVSLCQKINQKNNTIVKCRKDILDDILSKFLQ